MVSLPQHAQIINQLYQQFCTLAISEFQQALQQRDNTKAVTMVTVLCELSLKDDAIKTYIDSVCGKLVASNVSSDKFSEHHLLMNESILKVFSEEISSSQGGRILQIFGGDLWYRISIELVNRYFKQEYKTFIQEALDTEGKSKQLFLDILEECIDQTRTFFIQINSHVFKKNQLEINDEIESIL